MSISMLQLNTRGCTPKSFNNCSILNQKYFIKDHINYFRFDSSNLDSFHSIIRY